MQTTVSFPIDWLERGAARPLGDLDLALLLVNSHDLLEDPADRLGDLAWLSGVLTWAGHPDLASALKRSDLPRLRSLRAVLRAAFEASDLSRGRDVLNPQLVKARAVFLSTSRPKGPASRFVAGARSHRVRRPGGAAAGGGRRAHRRPRSRRLGICASDPCRCAYVDRTRAGTRRLLLQRLQRPLRRARLPPASPRRRLPG